MRCWTQFAVVLFILGLPPSVRASQKTNQKAIQGEALAEYVQRMQQQVLDLTSETPGSLWIDSGPLANLTADYKAAHVGDLLTILVVQDVIATSAGNVATNRTFSASSGIDALAGHIKTSGVASIFSPTSTQALAGKSQASTTSSLRTSLTGRVVAVLPNGMLVVEAERQLTMNNERQTVLVRGLVRTGDITPNNVVLSNAIGNLQLELKGKGVLSDGIRPPNLLVRMLLRVVGF